MTKANDVILERERIKAEINRIKAEMEDATRRLWGREYVWPRQRAGRDRLKRDLNKQLDILNKQYEALEECELDE